MQALLQHFDTDIGIVREPGADDPQLFGVPTVGKDVRREDATAVVVDRAQHRRAGAVAEQDGRVAPTRRLVEPARMHFRADEQNLLVLPRADPGVRDGEAVDKSAALIAYVDGGNVGEAELA